MLNFKYLIEDTNLTRAHEFVSHIPAYDVWKHVHNGMLANYHFRSDREPSNRKMGFKCSVIGCFTNYKGYDKGTVFLLPSGDKDQRLKWLKFLNRNDAENLKNVYICQKHFDENVLIKTPTRVKLNNEVKPVPTNIPG